MILTSRGRSINVDGKTYYVGMPVIAKNCVYEGLHGEIAEIRTGDDMKSDNSGLDFHCSFTEPEDWAETERLERRFTRLCGTPKTIREIALDDVVIATDMLVPDRSRMITNDSVKRVIWNTLFERFEQWQALKKDGQDYYTLQSFDDELRIIEEMESNYRADWEVLEHWRHKCQSGFFQIQCGLICDVLRRQTGDTTNGGVSSRFNTLSLIGNVICTPFEITDIRATVRLCKCERIWQCRPLAFPTGWYMAGGNFIHSLDGRFQDICGYPISVLDRREGS